VKRLDSSIHPQERLELATTKLMSHLARRKLFGRQKRHAQCWAWEAAHATFQLHPELREEGSLLRYFVAKEGRRMGLRGTALTQFVEGQYRDGTWWKLVPESVLKGEPKPA